MKAIPATTRVRPASYRSNQRRTSGSDDQPITGASLVAEGINRVRQTYLDSTETTDHAADGDLADGRLLPLLSSRQMSSLSAAAWWLPDGP